MVLGQILLTPKMDSNANLGGAISQFYAGKSIFITGVTGFCGKVLLHKLLDSCPELETIYVLIRPKRNELPQGNQITVVAFQSVQSAHASFLQKNQMLQNVFLISVMLRWHRASVACKNQSL